MQSRDTGRPADRANKRTHSATHSSESQDLKVNPCGKSQATKVPNILINIILKCYNNLWCTDEISSTNIGHPELATMGAAIACLMVSTQTLGQGLIRTMQTRIVDISSFFKGWWLLVECACGFPAPHTKSAPFWGFSSSGLPLHMASCLHGSQFSNSC